MKIAIIGAGAMGGSLAQGMLNAKVVPAQNLIVADPMHDALERFAKQGAQVTTYNREAVEQADFIFLVVKPWLAEDVLEDISDLLTDEKCLVSVAAGVGSESLKKWAGEKCSLFMAIPNIAIAHKASMTFLTPVSAVSAMEELTKKVKSLFDEMGRTCICDEAHLSLGMALASCGIAYAFRYIRAASEGGVELGFKASQAQEIVMQTVKGAVALLEADNLHPEEAIDRVTTPGGYTIKGLNAMEEAGFTNAVIKGLKASVKK